MAVVGTPALNGAAQANADLCDSQIRSLVPRTDFSRRAFAMTTVGAGFALAAQPIQAQTVIHTPDKDLTAGMVRVRTADAAIPAYRAFPKGKVNLPVVLVIHEVFGVHEHIRDLCRRLALAGYYAIAPDLYARIGDATQVSEVMGKLERHDPGVVAHQVLTRLKREEGSVTLPAATIPFSAYASPEAHQAYIALFKPRLEGNRAAAAG